MSGQAGGVWSIPIDVVDPAERVFDIVVMGAHGAHAGEAQHPFDQGVSRSDQVQLAVNSLVVTQCVHDEGDAGRGEKRHRREVQQHVGGADGGLLPQVLHEYGRGGDVEVTPPAARRRRPVVASS